GMFINTLPARIVLGEQSLEASLRQTQALLADLMRHEHAPLALAQRSSGVPAPAPLFSSLLNYRHSPGAGQASPVETAQAWDGIEMLYGGEERTNYPCTLAIDDLGEGFLLTAQVQAPVKPERLCAMMRTALERLVEALEIDSRQMARSLDILPEEEKRQVILEWNASRAAYPREKCIHQLFQAQAELTPEAVAVIHQDRQLSYGELNLRANRLAHFLRELGVGPDVRVGFCVERSPDMLVGLLAVLKAGGAYIPLDPCYPPERLGLMLRDSSPLILLTESSALSVLADLAGDGLVLDIKADAARWSRHPAHNPEPDRMGLGPEHLAYVIYTSGSTGAPKGVMVHHSGVISLLWCMLAVMKVDAADCLLALTTLSFDIAGLELFLPLICGARTALVERTGSYDPASLAAVIPTHGVTGMQATPATWRLLLEAGWPGPDPLRGVCGGGALSRGLADKLCRGGGRRGVKQGSCRQFVRASRQTVERLWPDRNDDLVYPVRNQCGSI